MLHKIFGNEAHLLLLVAVVGCVVLVAFANQASGEVNTIRQVIKLMGTYPANSSSATFKIDPPLNDTSKAFIFMSFAHSAVDDHADTFRSWEILNTTAFRVNGETTATGNNALDFEAYIIEYTGTISVQHSSRTWATSESAGEKSVTISAVNTTNTMVISKGHDHDTDETTIGSEELDRIRLLTSTTWGQLIFTNPNTSPQNNFVEVVDWKQNNISVQRGIVTMTSGTSVVNVSPATAVTKSRTALFVTWTCGTGCTTTEEGDDFMLRATLTNTSPPVINIKRVGTEDDMQIAWELIQFPADFVRVQYNNVTLAGGTATATDAINTVQDMDKSIAISTSGTPFGWGTGTTSDTTAGNIDRAMNTVEMVDNAVVSFTRGNTVGSNVIEYQVIEFLEPQFTQISQGTNTFKQVVKLDGNYTAGNKFQDFTLPSAVQINKTLVFMSVNSTNKGTPVASAWAKNWELISPTKFRIWGSQGAFNQPADFRAVFVEFTNASPIFTQFDMYQQQAGIADGNQTLTMSQINKTGSYISKNGLTQETSPAGTDDPTIGSEELTGVTITNGTRWTIESDTALTGTGQTQRVQVVDFNQNNIFTQTGSATLSGTTTTITPPTAIDRTRSILLVNYETTNDVLGAFPTNSSIFATLDATNKINITRATAGASITANWQIITFPSGFVNVLHGISSMNAGTYTKTDTLATPVGNLSKSIIIGTVQQLNSQTMGSGNSIISSDFDSVIGRMKLLTTSTANFKRGDANGNWNVGYQVLEFSPANTFNVNVIDTTTVTDQVRKTTGKVAVDFSTYVDLSTGNTLIRAGTDVASVSDLTKKNTTKGQNDTSSIIDTTTKNTTKVQTDTVTVTDVVIPVTIFVVRVNDTGTVIDTVNMNITKRQSDVSGFFDNVNLNTTKIFLDSAVVFDSTKLTKSTNASSTETATSFDNLRLNVTKLIQDATTVNDSVIVMRLLDLKINDTVIVNDPSIKLYVSTLANTTGVTSGGGGGGGIPTIQRLVGLSITSELFHVKAGDVVPSDFIIQTFGQEDSSVSLLSIKPDDRFISWFQYSEFPDTLEFETTLDSSRAFTDPARIKNVALDDFVLTVPKVQCRDISPFDPPSPCIEKKIYEAPMIFIFKKSGAEFREKHVVKIDATEIIKCDYACEFQKFINSSWWWLAGLVIMFTVLYFGAVAYNGKKVRVVNRIDRSYFRSFDADKPRKKFKKGKRR